MRLDNFLSTLGIIKRRTQAKEMADGGHVKINGNRAKPAHNVKVDDIIEITGKFHIRLRVTKIPESNTVPKPVRDQYFTILDRTPAMDPEL
jgi:ribosome-associated heat shock protein Hsp15